MLLLYVEMELILNVLEEANIQDADYFVATTGNDESNLLSCILVKNMKCLILSHVLVTLIMKKHLKK